VDCGLRAEAYIGSIVVEAGGGAAVAFAIWMSLLLLPLTLTLLLKLFRFFRGIFS